MTEPPLRGHCRVCRFFGRLRKDGTLYRHWSGYDEYKPDDNGAKPCSGWKQLPAASR